MTERTIYYLSPDMDSPSGGVRVLYRHVDILNANGRPAKVMHHSPGFKCTWFDHDTPVTCLRDVAFQREDVVVVPEVYGPEILEILRGVKKVVFNQSGFLTFDGTEMGTFSHTNVHLESGVIGAMAVSEYVVDYLSFVFPNLRTQRVRPSIDPNLFRFSRKKLPQIAFMPRRNSTDIHQVFNMLKWCGALNGFDVKTIHDAMPEEVARIMSESAFFFAFSAQEGFGLPSAEAMASGCVVVGYHGFGGREFMKPEFSFPVEPCDILGFARTAADAIEQWRYDSYKIQRMGRDASDFVAETYSPDAERESVLQAWSALVD